jgi:hypothetical protein
MIIKRFSAKSFKDMNDLGFSAEEYSKFKYGSKRVSRNFGTELGNAFGKSLYIKDELAALTDKELVVCSAPYKYIPVASTILKDYFISAFNEEWTISNPPVIDMKVSRGHSYNDDYGAMSEADRDKAISSDDFYIDKLLIQGKTLILIDDIRISGSHERRMLKLLEEAEYAGTVFFVYYAALVSSVDPTIENKLNYAFVKDLLSIDQIVKNDEFIFNTRVVKFILKSSPEEFKPFIQYQSDVFRHTLKTYAMGNGYHAQEAFKQNFDTLALLVK